MNKKLYFILSATLMFLIQNIKGQELNTFVCIHPTQANLDEFLTNIEIDDCFIYYNVNPFICNENKLYKRRLESEEKDSLSLIIGNIKLDSLKTEYMKNRYEAEYYLDFFIGSKNKSVEISIFQDEIPQELTKLFVYMQRLKNRGSFEAIQNEYSNINTKKLINNNDTIDMTSKWTYQLWKELSQNIIELELSDLSKLNLIDYWLPITYPVGCNNEFEKILVSKGKLYLQDDERKLYLLKGNYQIPIRD